jgi:hypothetical protein
MNQTSKRSSSNYNEFGPRMNSRISCNTKSPSSRTSMRSFITTCGLLLTRIQNCAYIGNGALATSCWCNYARGTRRGNGIPTIGSPKLQITSSISNSKTRKSQKELGSTTCANSRKRLQSGQFRPRSSFSDSSIGTVIRAKH